MVLVGMLAVAVVVTVAFVVFVVVVVVVISRVRTIIAQRNLSSSRLPVSLSIRFST
jgi:hypothetical protein